MVVAVVGVGNSGAHAAHALRRLRPGVALALIDRDRDKAIAMAAILGEDATVAESLTALGEPPEIVLLCVPTGLHRTLAETALGRGAHVVSIGDSIADVRTLLALDGRARSADRAVVTGAGFSPGLSCVLARHAAALFDEVHEITVAKSGTGGPDCARQHHRSLYDSRWEWRDGRWLRLQGGSGRRLAWFPEPIGALDCYRAALAEPFLLQRAFAGSRRVSARVAATRRDRLTGWLPMLRPPHPDGGPGGLRVEMWGERNGVVEVVVYGAADHPARVAGSLAAVVAGGLLDGTLPSGRAYGLAEVVDPTATLTALASLGVVASVFEGAA